MIFALNFVELSNFYLTPGYINKLRHFFYCFSKYSLLILLFSFFYLSLGKNTFAALPETDICFAVPSSKTCIDLTPCKLDTSGVLICLSGVPLVGGGLPSASNPLGALSVAQTCWQYSFEYSCTPRIEQVVSAPVVSDNLVNEISNPTSNQVDNGCTSFQSNSACSLINSVCSNQTYLGVGNNQCLQFQQTYSCLDQSADASSTVANSLPAVCNAPLIQSSTLTLGGSSLSSVRSAVALPSTNAFSQAAIAMEVASEMQTYSGCSGNDPEACVGKLLFSGVPESCSKGWLGLKNCCATQSGAKSNSAILGMLLGSSASVIKYIGETAVDTASPYVFDAMYVSGAYTQGMASALTQSANVITNSQGFADSTIFASSGVSLGAFGFTLGMGSAPASSGLFGATSQLDFLSSSTNGYFVSFNPYVFAGSLAISVVESLEQCTPSENLLAMHRRQDLSVYVSESCSESLPITGQCLSYKDNFCSFNGVLGKIINQQGKAQLGMEFSSCVGLSSLEIAKLDFSKINFSEFTGQIIQQAQSNLPQNIRANYSPIVPQLVQSNQQAMGNGLSYPLPQTDAASSTRALNTNKN